MFAKVFLLFALVALAFANPKPEPQAITYAAGAYPYAGYATYPYAYSAGYTGYPYAYSGFYYR